MLREEKEEKRRDAPQKQFASQHHWLEASVFQLCWSIPGNVGILVVEYSGLRAKSILTAARASTQACEGAMDEPYFFMYKAVVWANPPPRKTFAHRREKPPIKPCLDHVFSRFLKDSS